jgi:hypothetical protein
VRGLQNGVAGATVALLAAVVCGAAGAAPAGGGGADAGAAARAAERATPASVRAAPATTVRAAPVTTPASPTIAVQASPAAIVGGHRVKLSGQVTGALPGSTVDLYASPYPYPTAKLLRTSVTGATGSFSFVVTPDRNTRYRVALAGSTASAIVTVSVSGLTLYKVRALPLGKAKVIVVVYHPRDLRWAGARVSWSFAPGFRGRYSSAHATRARRLSPHVIVLWTTVTLPAGHFRWRVCFHAHGDHALRDSRRPRGCRGWGYYGFGYLPVGFPSPHAAGRAAGYLGGRAGRTAFAVVDSEGRMSGVHEHWTFVSASVVKAMLLVAYLRRLHGMGHHHVDSFSNSFLYPMINVSDNSAATQTWSIVGDSSLYSVAHAAGMTDFSIVGIWANAQISAADQAKFFFEMDSLIPGEFVGYARYLLSTIAGYESWGIPAVARPRGYTVFFKGGWRGTGLGQLVHQVARVEGHRLTFSIAVMTDGDPSMGYGIGTIEGVAARLL